MVRIGHDTVLIHRNEHALQRIDFFAILHTRVFWLVFFSAVPARRRDHDKSPFFIYCGSKFETAKEPMPGEKVFLQVGRGRYTLAEKALLPLFLPKTWKDP